MDKLSLDFGENSYDILFERDFDGLVCALKNIAAAKKLLIVTDENVNTIYGSHVRELLQCAGYDVCVHSFPAGEENKNMQTILDICSSCISHRMDRKSMIIALGGGVVGDMAGFAAAIYMRGIPFVQVPTTLLSQSDSSVGGKTGIDFADNKNILGAFHQPRLVYINVSVLKTLSEREFISGMGEVVKHGVIYDKHFFEYLKFNADKVKELEPDTLIHMVKCNCTIKADVVVKDEKENGLRAILNFGHTIGHALESAFHFKMTHGACVGLGMCAEGFIAKNRGMISQNELDEIKEVLGTYKIPTSSLLPKYDDIFSFMENDKKKADGRLKFILPTAVGSVMQVDDVTRDEIHSALSYIDEK
ncbi:MAG: 3-dehydroquinate synthase [Clostridia bacterium]|nr:3-dehydroquinate synthase [Clostridia bacterium]